MKEFEKYQIAMGRLPEYITEAEAQIERYARFTVSRENGADGGGAYSDIAELFVRASGDSGTGMIYTQQTEMNAMEAIEAAYRNSLFSVGGKSESMNSGNGKYEVKGTAEEKSNEEMRAWAGQLEKSLYETGYRFANLKLELSRVKKVLAAVNSKGLDISSEYLMYQLSVQAAVDAGAAEKDIVSMEYDVSAENLEDITSEKVAGILNKEVRNHVPLLAPRSGIYEAVLDESVVSNMLLTIWKMFSAVNYINGTSVLSGKLGQRVAEAKISIADRVKSPYTGYVFEYDCQGSKGKDVYAVEDGIFTGLLHNISTGENFSCESTGNAGRNVTLSGTIQTDTVVTPKNFTLLPGEKTTQQLVSDIRDGIYINHSFDEFHGVDCTTGDFTIPCEGILIENGEVQGRINNVFMEGNLLDIFADITEIGSDMYTFPIKEIKSYTLTAPALKLRKIRLSM